MYEVIDTQTKQRIGTYGSLAKALSRADKLDLQYGAIRYLVRRVAA